MIRVLHLYLGTRKNRRVTLPCPPEFNSVASAGATISVITPYAEFCLGYEDETKTYRISSTMYQQSPTLEKLNV